MNINDLSDFFKNLINETDNHSELKIYKKFLAILTDLKKKDLSDSDFLPINNELEY
jgi:hypothetical protein